MYYADKVVNFLLFLRRLQKRNKSSLCTIYGCDETPVWFENVGNCTINSVGARRITIRSTGHDKLRGTVMLAGKADYTRCRHIVMFKRIQPVQGLQEKFSNLVIAYSSNTRRNEELPHLYIGRVIGWLSFAPRLRVWNAYGWHVMDSTTSKVKSCQVAVIPGVCTKFLQPADISWNKNFKSKLSTLYDAWMERDEHEFSASGNICAPNRLKNMWMKHRILSQQKLFASPPSRVALQLRSTEVGMPHLQLKWHPSFGWTRETVVILVKRQRSSSFRVMYHWMIADYFIQPWRRCSNH